MDKTPSEWALAKGGALPPRRRLRDIARALDAARADGKRDGLRLALTAARGGESDYLGGYRTDADLAIFRHGMGTIVRVLEALAEQDPTDTQTAACLAMGRAIERGAGR